MKKLDKKTKQKIINILLNILGVLVVLILVVGSVIYYFIEKDLGDKIAFYIFLPLDIIWIVLYYTFGEGSAISTNRFKCSNKYSFQYKDFKELYEEVNQKLSLKGYSINKEYKINEKEKVYIYMKSDVTDFLELWIISNLVTYTENKEKKLQEFITDFYDNNIKSETSKKVRLKSFNLICVQRYSEELEKVVKETYTDGLLSLTIGLSFPAKEIYIASAKELKLTFTSDYDYLKNEFFKIVEATLIDKKKDKGLKSK